MRTLEHCLEYTFAKPELLAEALTHSSWINESGSNTVAHNERMEFLGDAVLELCISHALYQRFPGTREGDLTRVRAGLVNTRVLADMARELGIASRLRLGRGEESQGGRERAPLLADAFEAVLGAVFLDGGFVAARGLVDRLFAPRWPKEAAKPRRKDYKTTLQEATQRLPEAQRGLPLYIPDGSEGPEHARIFAVVVELPDGRRCRATGVSRKGAEQESARLALEMLAEAALKG